MAGIQRQHPETGPTTPAEFGFGLSKPLCQEAGEWCDSGLDSLGPPGFGDAELHCEWKTAPPSVDRDPARPGPDPAADTCASLGGDRLDSALGDSITEELLSSISLGLGTMDLAAGEGGDTAGTSSAEPDPAQEQLARDELFKTMTFISEDGDTALHLALIHEHWPFLQYLLSVVSLNSAWTCYLDIQNHLHQTALHIAVIVNRWECVHRLLCAGANPELQERGGNTALHIACREGRVECVRALVAIGGNRAQLHVTNYTGVTALHLAVQRGDEEIVRLLLDAGVNVNQSDQGSGHTPLHWAVEKQNPTLVQLLLSRGAVVNAPTYAGHTPLQFALYRPNTEVRRLLRAGGAAEPQEEEDEEEDEEEEIESEEEFDDLTINGHRVL
ncbi:NF-kappa-B inhibitor beta [Amia ocellicauda]|uniref:NF-kappa-B inhibitor beta n=1 Tax=Amia ocellicauda TaxID=2972642 RepID=UPI003463AF80